jgi:hypothetical protein
LRNSVVASVSPYRRVPGIPGRWQAFMALTDGGATAIFLTQFSWDDGVDIPVTSNQSSF